jgi:uncharacterized membrane protein
MGALIAGFAVLILLLLLAQGFVAADVKSLAKAMRIAGGVIVALIAMGLALAGRIFFAAIAASIAAAIFTGGPMPWSRRSNRGRDGATGRPRGSAMSKEEALKVLGLEAGASAEDIRAAHRRLILQTHPDKGGTSYLAAQINQAKDVLLGE